jgi:hypothetical protein
MWMCTPASSASCRCAERMAIRAAFGPFVPRPSTQLVVNNWVQRMRSRWCEFTGAYESARICQSESRPLFVNKSKTERRKLRCAYLLDDPIWNAYEIRERDTLDCETPTERQQIGGWQSKNRRTLRRCCRDQVATTIPSPKLVWLPQGSPVGPFLTPICVV